MVAGPIVVAVPLVSDVVSDDGDEPAARITNPATVTRATRRRVPAMRLREVFFMGFMSAVLPVDDGPSWLGAAGQVLRRGFLVSV